MSKTIPGLDNKTLKGQRGPAWCTGHVVSVISKLFNGSNGWEPCEIVGLQLSKALDIDKTLYLGSDKAKKENCNCCGMGALPRHCDSEQASMTIQMGLDHVGITSVFMRGCPTTTVIKNWIDRNIPIPFYVEKKVDAAIGHVAMIVGYGDEISGDDNFIVKIYDPAFALIRRYRDSRKNGAMDVTYPQLSGGQYPNDKYEVKNHVIPQRGGKNDIADWAKANFRFNTK